MDRIAELERKLENMMRLGTVDQVSGKRCRVKSGKLLTGWLPWFTQRAGDDSDWWPVEVGEQVMILSPGGDLSHGYVLPAINSTDRPPPSTNHNQRVIRFEDGTTLSYDKVAHKLSAFVKGDVDLFLDGNLQADAGGTVTVVAEGDIAATSLASVRVNAAEQAFVSAQAASVVATTITLTGAVQVSGPLTLAGPLSAAPGAAGGGATLQGNLSIQGNVDITGTLTNNGKEVGSNLRVSGVTPGPGTSGNPV